MTLVVKALRCFLVLTLLASSSPGSAGGASVVRGLAPAQGAHGRGLDASLSQALAEMSREQDRFQKTYRRLLMIREGSDRDDRRARYARRLNESFSAARRLLVRRMVQMKKEPAPAESGRLTGYRVILDPGHGGEDSGAVGTFEQKGEPLFTLMEKDLTLDVSRRVALLLRQAGAEVVMTRGADETLDLHARGILARHVEADALVSIHFNWSPLGAPEGPGTRAIPGVNYTTVYIHAPVKRNLSLPGSEDRLKEALDTGTPRESSLLAAKLQERLRSALKLDYTLKGGILREMTREKRVRRRLAWKRRATEKAGKKAGKARKRRRSRGPSRRALELRKTFYARYPRRKLAKGVRRADFAVLRETSTKAAVLVETSFISDRAELLKLHGDPRRDAASRAIFEGLADYLQTRPRRAAPVSEPVE